MREDGVQSLAVRRTDVDRESDTTGNHIACAGLDIQPTVATAPSTSRAASLMLRIAVAAWTSASSRPGIGVVPA